MCRQSLGGIISQKGCVYRQSLKKLQINQLHFKLNNFLMRLLSWFQKAWVFRSLCMVAEVHMGFIHFRLQITSCDCNITASVVLEAPCHMFIRSRRKQLHRSRILDLLCKISLQSPVWHINMIMSTWPYVMVEKISAREYVVRWWAAVALVSTY